MNEEGYKEDDELVSGILVKKHEQGGAPPSNRLEIEAGFKQ